MSYFLLNIPHLLAHHGYWGVFIIVFLESGIFFPLPGDSLLFTAGLLSTTFKFKLLFLIPIIFLATFLGAVVGYIIGVYLEQLHKYAFFRKILRKDYIHRAHEFFERHGQSTIIISRFVAVVRTFVPIVAGIARMNFRKFVSYSIVGSALWATVVTTLGYYLGKKFPWLAHYISLLAIGVVLASVIPLVFEWWRRRRNRTK